jgi:toxin ParE1/3/4
LDAIEGYISARNRDAAYAVIDRIIQQIEKLAFFPYLGRSGRKPGSRTLVVPRLPYLVVYEVLRDEIVVLGVTHSARNWQNDPRFR